MRVPLKSLLSVLTLFTFVGCEPAAQDRELNTDVESVLRRGLAIRRSLAVTNLNILNRDQRFSFHRVLTQITAGTPTTPEQFYQRWWNTQNDAANSVADSELCDDVVGSRGPELNGYPIQCPRQEGVLAATNPFSTELDSYFPIGLFNRFDLAPDDGAHCGEYRIIYGKRNAGGLSALLNPDRNLIIFEAQLPNPDPNAGLEGCRKVAEFWAALTAVENPATRANRLATFYFDGIPGFAPAIKAEHFGPDTGQIRTNQFMNGREYLDGDVKRQPWQLREFKVVQPCEECDIAATMVTDKGNPFAELFDDESDLPLAAEFRTHFIGQLPTLIVNDVNGFGMAVPDQFNAAESTSQGTDSDSVFHFRAGSGVFADELQQAIVEEGAALSAVEVVRRAKATTCAGCHQLNNTFPENQLGGGVVWPRSLTFVHVSEQNSDIEPCGELTDGMCWGISEALSQAFLPDRKRNITQFLVSGWMPRTSMFVH